MKSSVKIFKHPRSSSCATRKESENSTDIKNATKVCNNDTKGYLYKGTRGGVQDKSDCLASPSEHYTLWNDLCHSLKIQGGFLIFCILVNQIFMPLHLKLDLCADLISKVL